MSELTHWIAHAGFIADFVLRVGFSIHVIGRRLPVAVTLAWLVVILVFPFGGSLLYMYLGLYRLGPRRARRAEAYRKAHAMSVSKGAVDLKTDLTALASGSAAVARVIEATLAASALPGNRLELLRDADAAFPALIADIDRAGHSCDLEFYIWCEGGRADEVASALARAAKRGVRCRLLLDALGSKAFLKSARVFELRNLGVRVEQALPGGLLRLLFRRPDLRLHRKIAVIDGAVGYTGSLNLADPKLFKRDAGVGQWVDAFARVEGPAVAGLAATFDEDWALETGESSDPAASEQQKLTPVDRGKAVIQVLPTGPAHRVGAIEQVVLMALYAAQREVILTTPYFVPSEPMVMGLLAAANRGVTVTLIVPARVDSRLVQFASRALQTDLLAAGVRVALFQRGLLHTKSITVDDQFSLFGSLNLDPRSLRLNFEITLAVHDAGFTSDLRALQQSYLAESELLNLNECQARSVIERFAEDSARLVGPIL
jgi:cardiolipin synthase